jgi:hypothetical protein
MWFGCASRLLLLRFAVVLPAVIDPEHIDYFGRSLGKGTVCDLVTRHPPRALILISTFTSMHSMARKYLRPAFLGLDDL